MPLPPPVSGGRVQSEKTRVERSRWPPSVSVVTALAVARTPDVALPRR